VSGAFRRLSTPAASRALVLAGLAIAAVGVFLRWTTDDPVAVDGTEGPNNGWLVVVMVAFAAGWTRSLLRGSRAAAVGVIGAAVVIAWTALENWYDGRQAADAAASYGLLLVIAGSVLLASGAVLTAAQAWRDDSERVPPDSPESTDGDGSHMARPSP
jgi:uncharacterized membrane protein YhhN